MQCENHKRRASSLEGPGAATSRRFEMTSMLRKAAISTIAALTLGAGITATATPSMAASWHGHGRHGGGWHGGGLHGGYWRGGRWYGGGWGGGRSRRAILSAASRSARSPDRPMPTGRAIMAGAMCKTGRPMTAGAILWAINRSRSAIDFGPVAQSPAKRRGFNFFSISV
jgi:hypothetical protein